MFVLWLMWRLWCREVEGLAREEVTRLDNLLTSLRLRLSTCSTQLEKLRENFGHAIGDMLLMDEVHAVLSRHPAVSEH